LDAVVRNHPDDHSDRTQETNSITELQPLRISGRRSTTNPLHTIRKVEHESKLITLRWSYNIQLRIGNVIWILCT